MRKGLQSLHGMSLILAVLIAVGMLAGLVAMLKRYSAEMRNRRIEIGVDYVEVDTLAQTSGQPLVDILRQMKHRKVTSLILSEDTLSTLEQTGGVRIGRFQLPDGSSRPTVEVYSPETLDRIRQAVSLHGLHAQNISADSLPRTATTTLFYIPSAFQSGVSAGASKPPISFFAVEADYQHLRGLGLGLPPAGIQAAKAVDSEGLAIVGRIANFPGVTVESARAVLENLKAQGVSLIIFNGDDVLGYRGLEKEVAGMLRDPAGPPLIPNDPAQQAAPTGLIYGDVEFSKQRGAELISGALRGDYVRVHSIQTAELGLMDANEVVERFVRAARERNIRFCYVRLLTTAGTDAVDRNLEMFDKIARGIEHGGPVIGGGLKFGTARRFPSPNVSVILYALIGLGVAAGTLWMLRELAPLPNRYERGLLFALLLLCVGLAVLGESGRRLLALLAGIVFPAAACLRVFPRPSPSALALPLPPRECLARAVRAILDASAVTAIGIVAVIGLLASRPFMLRANQFLGIKAQHAVPLLIVAFVALVGGVARDGERWTRYRNRVTARLHEIYNEPARYGVMLLGIIALAALALIVARTGNDAGVGVSATEMKTRALLDRILPVRPRTKEFLVGHPAFILALAWWWRGRRKLALPCFVVGSIGQVSLLNTFCHIHTPLIISLWRDALGLVIGAALGGALFLLIEKIAPPPHEPLHEADRKGEDTISGRNGPHKMGADTVFRPGIG